MANKKKIQMTSIVSKSRDVPLTAEIARMIARMIYEDACLRSRVISEDMSIAKPMEKKII